MKKVKVLVTAIGGPTAQGVLRRLREKENVFIVGADRRTVTSGNQFCDVIHQIPRFTELDAYKKAIAEIVEKEQIDVIFPSLHEEIEIYHTFRNELPALVALPESEDFEVLKDKEKVYEFLAEHNLHRYIPKYVGFTDTDDVLKILGHSFPEDSCVVVKEVSGYGAMGFSILTSRENYLKALKAGKNKVVNIADYCDIPSSDKRIAMEYLDGQEYSVDVFLHKGKVVVAVPRERTGVSSGLVLDGKVVFNEDLIQAATEITECIATDGFINLQFFQTESGYKLTDVNARFCGSQVMSLGAGVNFPYLFIQYNLLGETAAIAPKWNTRMIRYREHFFIYED